ncbi:MAG TPA: NADH-quinone oxidoreductase subunit L [Pirellulales bacterium]|jgi:NADH-quinone oxidoreductase subunit L|nr:NADH-quinone oxidoreductase subunit L [Pirellulales bacterium]
MTETLLILIPALPLAAAVLTGCLGPWLKSRSHWPVVIALVVAFLASLMLLKEVNSDAEYSARTNPGAIGYEKTYTLWTWANVHDAYPAQVSPGSPAAREMPGSEAAIPTDRAAMPAAGQSPSFSIGVTLRADALTSMMLSMVTFISSLVAIYSIGYMHGDRGYWRFFSYIGLFVFSMTMLVSVSNFVLLYVFWEAVGLCSYLLIGFWYEKPSAVAAGKKAFLVNRIGDFGFGLGLFLIWTTYGTLDFHDTVPPVMLEIQNGGGIEPAHVAREIAEFDSTHQPGVLGQIRLSVPNGGGYVGGAVGTAICLLLLAGACGKSAQFPLYVWLPDAMEGPTPVSALIHAATMVTAGVYMIARCTPLFFAAPQAQHAVALIGCFTALLAALIALTQTDLKRVLAYSTVSQLGYMFLSLGIGWLPGIIFGMFHLFTHAFFKALLFLGAGSVMHSMGGVIDMRKFGGLRKLMPITCITFLAGCLALAGVWPFAGFWSKDGILATTLERGQAGGSSGVFGIHGLTEGGFFTTLYWVGLATALLTAFYTFRAFFWTFCGPEKIPEEAGHHAHESPRTMTVPLMVLAVCATIVGFMFLSSFEEFLKLAPSLAWHAIPAGEVSETIHTRVGVTSTLVALLGIGVAAFLYLGDRKHVDALTRIFRLGYELSYGKFFVDPLYDWLIVRPLHVVAWICNFVDRWLIDGLVNLFGAIPPLFGAALRSLQNGVVQFYAMAMILGLLVLIGTLIPWPK